MSIKINAQTVIFKGKTFDDVTNQERCEYCRVPFKTFMVIKKASDPSVKSEVPIEVNDNNFNYCPNCGRKLK